MHEIDLLTIVTESILKERLIADLKNVGATGWTLSAAQGEGPRNRRVSEVEGGNIRVEILADPVTIARIWDMLKDSYFSNYAVAAWQSKVQVSRADRYLGNESQG
jgi:nitrogen regulatory protein P-II 2